MRALTAEWNIFAKSFFFFFWYLYTNHAICIWKWKFVQADAKFTICSGKVEIANDDDGTYTKKIGFIFLFFIFA